MDRQLFVVYAPLDADDATGLAHPGTQRFAMAGGPGRVFQLDAHAASRTIWGRAGGSLESSAPPHRAASGQYGCQPLSDDHTGDWHGASLARLLGGRRDRRLLGARHAGAASFNHRSLGYFGDHQRGGPRFGWHEWQPYDRTGAGWRPDRMDWGDGGFCRHHGIVCARPGPTDDVASEAGRAPSAAVAGRGAQSRRRVALCGSKPRHQSGHLHHRDHELLALSLYADGAGAGSRRPARGADAHGVVAIG